MNSNTKKRMVVATGIIVIVLILLLAFVGGNASAKTVSVEEAVNMQQLDKKIQVTGNVAENSFKLDGNVLEFEIFDPEKDPAQSKLLRVSFDGGISATFGNDVTAICTGKLNAEHVLVCSELVTKCPSKYENATGSLSVSDLLGYGGSIVGKPVKVSGDIVGNVGTVEDDVRFVLADEGSESTLAIRYLGALQDGFSEGAHVVLTGSVSDDGSFVATNAALEA